MENNENSFESKFERRKVLIENIKDKIFTVRRIGFLVFWAIVGVAFISVGLTVDHAMDQCDGKVTGIVEECEDLKIMQKLTVSYEIDGEDYREGTFSTKDKRYRRGDEIKLHYDYSEPEVVIDGSDFFSKAGHILAIIGVVIIILAIIPLAKDLISLIPESFLNNGN